MLIELFDTKLEIIWYKLEVTLYKQLSSESDKIWKGQGGEVLHIMWANPMGAEYIVECDSWIENYFFFHDVMKLVFCWWCEKFCGLFSFQFWRMELFACRVCIEITVNLVSVRIVE